MFQHPLPRVVPPLDPEFRPAVLSWRAFQKRACESGSGRKIELAVEGRSGDVSRIECQVEGDGGDAATIFQVERILKFLLWSRGGARVHVAGPDVLGRALQSHYRSSPTGRFDALMMSRIYDRPFEVALVGEGEMPAGSERETTLGGHWNGCRIGFDLGASDRKVAAVREGETLFSEETRWDPKEQTDPQWHYDQIMDSLKKAAAHLPRVDAIGGSSAGVIVGNQIKVASLFRGVPEHLFQTRVRNLFLDLRSAWNGIPFEVVNDGEVTALAGAQSIGSGGVLGIALGSSQAAGYVTMGKRITPWLNELAFAPVDYRLGAPVDEWSGDAGCGVQYFSQQAVGRLISRARIELPGSMPLPDRLVEVQNLMAAGDDRAEKIYRTIGVCFGYALAHYATFYHFEHLLILGRVTSGPGGQLINEEAGRVLRTEFPEMTVQFHIPDETEKRHGQAMTAASLAEVKGE